MFLAIAAIFTLVSVSGCAIAPSVPTAPAVSESKRVTTSVASLKSVHTTVSSEHIKKTSVITRDCLLDKAGKKTTDCIVVPNGTASPRATVYGSKEETYTPPAMSSNGVGPYVFGSKEACLTALRAGNYRYYEPKFLGLRNKHPADGEKRKVAPLEWDKCVYLHVVGGKKWVVQKTGTLFRYNVRADGKLEDVPYEHDACGNEVYGVADLPPEKRTVPGEAISRYGLFIEEIVEEAAPVKKRVVIKRRCCVPNPCCNQSGYQGGWGSRYYGGFR